MIDSSELATFGSRLVGSAPRSRALVAVAVRKGAQNVKEAIQADLHASSTPAFRRISIGYEIQTVGAGIAADIAPREGGASDLANIAFFGGARGGGGHEFYGHAADELPALAEYVGRAGQEAVDA